MSNAEWRIFMKKMLIVAGSAIAIFAGCQSTVMAQNDRVSTPDVHADNACSHHHCNRKERFASALRHRLEHAPNRVRSSQSSGDDPSGAFGFGGAATPNVRCPPGAYCLRP
jgi:hypothetical protein